MSNDKFNQIMDLIEEYKLNDCNDVLFYDKISNKINIALENDCISNDEYDLLMQYLSVEK